MGERIRALDWASTPIGSPATWPLKQTLQKHEIRIIDTHDSGLPTAEARDAIEARLIALSRSHDLLTRTRCKGGDVARRALALGMAFHKLPTSAVKYGALSNGAKLIECGPAGELGDNVGLDFAPSGVVCEIAVPARILQ
jgi:hypothetical protein